MGPVVIIATDETVFELKISWYQKHHQYSDSIVVLFSVHFHSFLWVEGQSAFSSFWLLINIKYFLALHCQTIDNRIITAQFWLTVPLGLNTPWRIC